MNTDRRILVNLKRIGFRRLLILFYGVAATIGFISLLSPSPGRTKVAIVLMMLAIGISIVAQRLRKSRFADSRADLEGKVSMSLDTAAFQRATEELRVAHDYSAICRILESAFASNGFEAFDLEANLLPGDFERSRFPIFFRSPQTVDFKWSKTSGVVPRAGSKWSMTLQLITTDNRRRGLIKIYRRYSNAPLPVDVSILESQAQSPAVKRHPSAAVCHHRPLR